MDREIKIRIPDIQNFTICAQIQYKILHDMLGDFFLKKRLQKWLVRNFYELLLKYHITRK